MGTGRKHRFYTKTTIGNLPSTFAVVHSNEGTFKVSLVKGEKNLDGSQKHRLRLASGCHGQDGIDLLDKFGIEYHVVKTYPNGVRVGYVPNHDDKRKRTGINQSWFPREWIPSDIVRAGLYVANLECNKDAKDGEIKIGVYKGVQIGIKKTDGFVATVFPTSEQPNYLWEN